MAEVTLDINGHKELVTAYVVPDLQYDVVLGKPFHVKHQPGIHHASGTVTFDSPYCLEHCLSRKRPVTAQSVNHTHIPPMRVSQVIEPLNPPPEPPPLDPCATGTGCGPKIEVDEYSPWAMAIQLAKWRRQGKEAPLYAF